MTLMEHVERYVSLKRVTGRTFGDQEKQLRDYAAYAEERGDDRILASTVLDWATRTSSNRQGQYRLRTVCAFATVLQAEDDHHEVPHPDALGKQINRRKPPHLPSKAQIRAIMEAALSLPPAGSLTPLTFHTIIGLVAATGMRRSEATGLTLNDVTLEGLLVRHAKNDGTRLLPLHESATRALDDYLEVRLKKGGTSEHLFVLANGNPVKPSYLTHVFIRLARETGTRAGPGESGVRLHDLRHAFAVTALENFNVANRKHVRRHMLAVSTYMGPRQRREYVLVLAGNPAASQGHLGGNRTVARGGGGTMTELTRLLNMFLCVWLPRDRNASPHTVVSYATSLNMLAIFAAVRHSTRPCKLEVEQLDTHTILAFLASLEEEHGNSVATRNARLAAVKSFFRFIEFRKPAYLALAGQVRAIPVKKGELPLIGNLDRAEVRALLDAPDRKTKTGIRDRAMMILTYNAGLRVSELVSLTPQDLKAPRFHQVRVMGKGRRERALPLWKRTTTALTAWFLIRPDVEDPHLFLNAMDKGMTRRGFAKRLALHGKTAARTVPSLAERRVNPHLLRHACAIHTLEETQDIRKVSVWLGHASIQTTEMYLRAEPFEKLETLKAWCPPGLRKGSFRGVQDELLAMLGAIKKG